MTHKMHSFRWFLALSLVLSMVLAACSGSKATAPPTATPPAPAGPKVKDTFTFAINREPDNFDPVTQDGNPNIWTYMNVYQTLIRLNKAGTDFEPDLAETWKSSDDGLTWTFNLRKNVKFSNGTPVTAKDVVFSLMRTKTLKAPWQWALADVSKIEAKDDATVVITLSVKSAPFLSNISLFSNAILSADFYKDATPEKFSNQLMGSGPYMLTEWKKGEYITLKANPNYYEAGLPKTPNVKILYIPDDDTRIIKLQSGEVDGIDAPPFARVGELKANPKVDMQLNPSTAVSHLSLNVRKGPLANKDFRQALAYSLDREGMVKAILFGNGKPATSFLPETTLFFDKTLKGYNFDLPKAKELMTKSGIPAGTKLEILFPAGNQVRQQIATVAKDMWGKLGVDVQLMPMDSAAANAKYKADDFQIFVTGWTNDIPDPSQLASYELGFKESKSYHSGYQSDKMDQMIAAGVREMDVTKRAQIYKDIQALAIEDSPLIWLYYAPYTLALNKSVEGFSQMTTGPWVFKNVVVKK